MEDNDAARAAAVVRALAALSPSSEQKPSSLVVPLKFFRWLPALAVGLFEDRPEDVHVRLERDIAQRLAAIDQVRLGQRSLKAGWLFLAGTVEDAGGKPRRVFSPLVTVPVRVEWRMIIGAPRLVAAGDVELTQLITDPAAREALEPRMAFGGDALDAHNDVFVPVALLSQLRAVHFFAFDAAEAAGMPTRRLVPVTGDPDGRARDKGLTIVAGCGVYAEDAPPVTSRAASLLAWDRDRLTTPTALHALYLGSPPGYARPSAGTPVDTPFVLTPAQRASVRQSRSAPVTVIAGAPGTGKTHTIAAIAGDALARDEAVLIAAKSDATVDALLDLLQRTPGPDPVVFGSSERRRQLATRLADGAMPTYSADAVRDARHRLDEATQHRDAIAGGILEQLRAEELSTQGALARTDAWTRVPLLFEPIVDLADVAGLVSTIESSQGGGWWARRRARKAARRLSRLTGTPPDGEGLAKVKQTLPVAEAARVAAALASRGGLQIAAQWQVLREADDHARELVSTWLAADAMSVRRFDAAALVQVAALATALRSGRSARRQHLRRLNSGLTTALPLWVGTLADIDDLLPPIGALFDLVILDEASSIDQPLSASALLRGRRAVIVGDPRQLRHVSFIGDNQTKEVLEASGLDLDPILATRLDVRRNSAFDVASGAAPVNLLDEHFRCDPHLVDFVARRLYDGRVHVATRSPMTEGKDCVERRRVEGFRDDAGVVQAEVDAIVHELERLLTEGRRSVGVVTPFRAQADALEEAVLARFTAGDLEALDLRVGTVHQFQGNERDTVLASLAIGPDETGTQWNFVNDPHLLAVLLTRARRAFVVFQSADPPPGSLLADYLAQADRPPGRPEPDGLSRPWAATVAHDLADGGVAVAQCYPVGRHIVELVAGDAERAFAVDCGVHPDGPAAHVERNLALLRAGWHIVDAFESKWGERRGELTVELLSVLRPQA